MDNPAGMPLPNQADGMLTESEAGDGELPLRHVPDRRVLRRIRRMDDPEILERVLAGLLNLR